MAKKGKRRIDKSTYQLLEATSDLVRRKKGSDRYKFKSKKKKDIRKIKNNCVHWIIRKGKEVPAVQEDPMNPRNWKCLICGATFPIKPELPDLDVGGSDINRYDKLFDQFGQTLHQFMFWSVGFGGNENNTKMVLKMRALLREFRKSHRNILKAMNKRQKWEDNKKNTDGLNQFNTFSSYSYRP